MWIPDFLSGTRDLRADTADAAAAGIDGAALDVVVTRGGRVEARHRVHAAVVRADGTVEAAVRDPHLPVWWRSCAKPFQVMPLLRSGGFDALGWGDDELALACASHGGEPEHVAIAARMLARLGLDPSALACGPHEPLAARGARLAREAGPLSRLHNNCSGKHAAMLARAVQLATAVDGYHHPGHHVQHDCLASVAAWTGLPASAIDVGVDGCGVPVFGLPLSHMAWSYARLADAATRGDAPSRRVVEAMTRRAFLVGGTDRFDTLLMDACEGRVLCKIGAEGVHTVALLNQGIGFAIKVEDGAARAQYPAVLALLQRLGALPDPLPASLQPYLRRPVLNTRGESVGLTAVSPLQVGDHWGEG